MEETSSEVKKDNYQDKSTNESLWQLLKPQWKIFGQVIGQPWVIISLFIFLPALILSYFVNNKNLSLALSAVSSVFTAIMGAMCYDRYKQISGDTVLVKKGQGAVRSLFLIVEKIKNISVASNKRNNIEEIVNLLGLVEKDVVNSIQEWTDVIPVLTDIQISQKIIEDKEKEITRIQFQYDEASKKYEEEKVSRSKEKEDLKEKIADISKLLENEIRKIRALKLARDVTISKNISSASTATIGTIGPTQRAIGEIGPEPAIDNNFVEMLARERLEALKKNKQ